MTRKLLGFVLGALVLASCGGAPPEVVTVGAEPASGRLPSDVVPLAYQLALDIFPDQERFGGTAEIRVRLTESRNLIWLHGTAFEVTEATVQSESGIAVQGEWRNGEGDAGFASLRLTEALAPGEYTIRIAYTAAFDPQLDSLYTVTVGEDHYAYTQMEPLAARRAFPCFDEPRFKTPYDVTLTVAADNVAIANAPSVEETVGEDGRKVVRFATTRPMPSYLVAFAVGPFDVVEAEGGIPPNDVRAEPLPFRGIAVRGRGDELAYAMEHTPAILEIAEEYLGSAYPFAKLDIIAVPDFESGAMENPGAVTFRDTLLLFDGDDASVSTRRGFAFVMAHELAHMWFGNLVTMEWWDDLWLNEAVATWMETLIIQAWDEDYEADVALIEWGAWAMGVDSLPNARSIRNPITTPHDIHAAFDGITYSKGGAVIGMFEQWMGPERMQAGLRQYLQAHEWGTATGEDFLVSMNAAAEREVAAPFQSFLVQPGLPFLQTELICDGEGVRVGVRQARYVPTGSPASAEATWQIPMCIRFATARGSDVSCGLVEGAEGVVPLETRACPAWIVPNASGTGYYRYSIDPEQLRAIFRKGLRSLSVVERLSLVNSLVAAFENGSMDATAVMPALLRFARDRHYAVASAPMAFFRRLESRLLDAEGVEALRGELRSTYVPVLRRVRWNSRRQDSYGDRMMRTRVIPFLAEVARDPATRREAANRGRAWLEAEPDARTPHDALSTFISVALQDGDEGFLSSAVERLGAMEDGNQRRQLIRAIGQVRAPELASVARGLSLDERLRVNERLGPLYGQFSNRETRDAAWAWLQENYDGLVGELSPGHAASLPRLAATFCEEAAAQQLEAFFAERVAELPSGTRTLETALGKVRICAALRESQAASLAAWGAGGS